MGKENLQKHLMPFLHCMQINRALLLPMWMVSGALFPMATAHGWIRALMWINPLTYSIGLLNHLLHFPDAAPGTLASLVVTAVFGVLLLLLSGALASQKSIKSAA